MIRSVLACVLLVSVAVRVQAQPRQLIPAELAGKPVTSDRALPAILRPGMLITYESGASSFEGAWFEPSPNGFIEDTKGNRYVLKSRGKGSGGIGYTQLNLVAAGDDVVAADARFFLITDAKNTTTLSSETGIVGNRRELGHYWVHPTLLAAMKDVRKGEHVFAGQKFSTYTIRMSQPGAFIIRIYDAATGLLLAGGTSNVSPDVVIVDRDGQPILKDRGAGSMSHDTLVAVRDAKSPWHDSRAPRWAVKGAQIEMRGTIRHVIETFGQPPLPATPVIFGFTIDQVHANAVVTTFSYTTPPKVQGLPPDTAKVTRVYGSAPVYGLWAPPDTLKALKPKTVIDEDPLTRFRTTFLGIENDVAHFIFQGPLDTREFGYHTTSGMLVGIRNTKNNLGAGLTVTEVRLTGVK